MISAEGVTENQKPTYRVQKFTDTNAQRSVKVKGAIGHGLNFINLAIATI